MDKNGKSDPYVEVSIRPGKDVFKTATKHCSLNPTFNETFPIPLNVDDIDEGELMIKVLDSDFPLQDELIGIIRLPLNALELSASPKHHTCLILHEKGKNMRCRNMMSSQCAAKLNLKISHQTQELLDLQAQLRTIHESLEEARDESKKMRTKRMDLEMNNFQLKTELDALSKLPEIILAGPDENENNKSRSSPIFGSSTCFTCSLHNSNFLQQLKELDLLGSGDWQIRANRGMFLGSTKKMHDLIVPFIRRQSRAYLLAGITGMQSYLDGVMRKLVSHCFDLKKDSILLPIWVEINYNIFPNDLCHINY